MRALDWIEAQCQKITESGCWIWMNSLNRHGYGQISMDRAHRMAYKAMHGEIPDGKWVLHRCDVKCCCNPYHLYAGTRADNARDASERGLCGRKARIDDVQAKSIAERNAQGEAIGALSRELGCSNTAIRSAIKRAKAS